MVLMTSETAPSPVSNSNDTALISSTIFDVIAPPPANSFKGHYVPKVIRNRNRYRRISLERHASHNANGNKSEDMILRVLAPLKSGNRSISNASSSSVSPYGKKRSSNSFDEVASLITLEIDEVSTTNGHKAQWIERYKVAVQKVEVKKRVKNIVVIKMETSNTTQTREFIFKSENEANSFNSHLTKHQSVLDDRVKRVLKTCFHGNDTSDDINILIDIVSASDLPVSDLISSDPQVVVRIGKYGRVVHKTACIKASLNPIWTVQTKSLFILNTTPDELFRCCDGVIFELMDVDFVGSDSMGSVTIPPVELFNARGERMEYKIRATKKNKANQGTLAIRCRHATKEDIEFVEKLQKTHTTSSAFSPFSVVARVAHADVKLKGLPLPSLQKNRKTDLDGTELFRVMPGPDPKRAAETEFMSKEKIIEETYKPSNKWVDAGSGHLGKVFLEVLGCDNLPNMDVGGKTDPFVSIVFEDCVVNTDCITNKLSPRWMPWSQRAFCFHITHPSSQIFIGAFDKDDFSNDDFIGRVAVDITNLHPRMDYLLHYNLQTTGSHTKREMKGSIWIRLRIQYANERDILLSCIKGPPPSIHVNLKTKHDFFLTRTKIMGNRDMEKYGVNNICSYYQEILSYMTISVYVQEALINLLLWRGHFRLPILNISLPLHSLNAFILGIALVEKPALLPSFGFISIAWLLLSIMGFRRHSPSPWRRCKSFGEYMQILLLGKSSKPPPIITQNQNIRAAGEFELRWQERIKAAKKAAERRAEENLIIQAEYLEQVAEFQDVHQDIAAAGTGVTFDPMKPFLFPLQQNLAFVCDILRVVRNVILWEESVYSFWITTGSLVLAFLCYLVPWGFVYIWSLRITVWTLLGPWMKLVDIFYYSKLKEVTDDDHKEQKRSQSMKRSIKADAIARQLTEKREDAVKLKGMRTYLFGKYIARVPVLKSDRFYDVPLPDSTASQYKEKPMSIGGLAIMEAGSNIIKVPGQLLTLDITPKLHTASVTEAPIGQATRRTSLLLNDEGSRQNMAVPDSNLSAAIKVGSAMIVAGAVSWFGVPVMISSINWVNGDGWKLLSRYAAYGYESARLFYDQAENALFQAAL